MKKCNKCQETKELTEFYKNKKGIPYAECKPCSNKRRHEYRKTDKGKLVHQRYYTSEKGKQFYQTYRSSQGIQVKKEWEYKISGVYAIYDSGECLYVGESTRILNRISEHKTKVKNPSLGKGNEILYKQLACHKHLIFGVVEETSNHKEREQYWVTKLKPKYNTKWNKNLN
jgi:hypothetical protein